MNEQEQLKLQAYLDGELTGREREEVAGLLDHRADARELLAELQHVRAALRDGDPDVRLDCSREFYWSGIERALATTPAGSGLGTGLGLTAWLRRHLAPLAGAAAGLALMATTVLVFNHPAASTEMRAEGEWEVVHPDTGMVNYRDYQNGITVVMLYDRSTPGFTSGN